MRASRLAKAHGASQPVEAELAVTTPKAFIGAQPSKPTARGPVLPRPPPKRSLCFPAAGLGPGAEQHDGG